MSYLYTVFPFLVTLAKVSIDLIKWCNHIKVVWEYNGHLAEPYFEVLGVLVTLPAMHIG